MSHERRRRRDGTAPPGMRSGPQRREQRPGQAAAVDGPRRRSEPATASAASSASRSPPRPPASLSSRRKSRGCSATRRPASTRHARQRPTPPTRSSGRRPECSSSAAALRDALGTARRARERLNHLAEAPDGSERCTRVRAAAREGSEGGRDAVAAGAARDARGEARRASHDVGAAAGELDAVTLEAEHDIIEIPSRRDRRLRADLAEARAAANSSARRSTVKIEQYELARREDARRSSGATTPRPRQSPSRQAELDEARAGDGRRPTPRAGSSPPRQTVATRRNALERGDGRPRAARERVAARRAGREAARRDPVPDRKRSSGSTSSASPKSAYGRDGIPVLLVEPSSRSSRRRRTGSSSRCPRATASSSTSSSAPSAHRRPTPTKVTETLDILVADPDGQRAYETFSGGERARLNIALRIALAKLLAGRRGAESRLLAIDELEYLDVLGQGQLVDVVRGVEATSTPCSSCRTHDDAPRRVRPP
jgi:hypothetical protein